VCWFQKLLGDIQAKLKPRCELGRNMVSMNIAVYVDDHLTAAKDPKEITKALMEHHKFKLKGVGTLTYHLGCDYFPD
jgi:hypothetical protein